ncbi:MAG: peptidoglycan-associated lipoprotein Pal [Candidatus Rokuibacteriota bacterium]|nr:MAG: peptidoglycan-associated lipoprotein Pal [Candidatus Rokubacteria bacterium]
MVTRAAQVTWVSLLLAGLMITGCAKRPATTAATTAAPAPAPPATSSAPAPTQPAPSSGAAAPAAPAAPGQTPRPSPKEFMAVAALKEVYFDFDKYDIRAEDAKTLDANAAWLKSNADNLVLIEGHCDERGTNEYNLALGERRAKATMNYLVSQGIQANRITIISYGEERPVCSEKTEACWAKNRRASFLVKPR